MQPNTPEPLQFLSCKSLPRRSPYTQAETSITLSLDFPFLPPSLSESSMLGTLTPPQRRKISVGRFHLIRTIPSIFLNRFLQADQPIVKLPRRTITPPSPSQQQTKQKTDKTVLLLCCKCLLLFNLQHQSRLGLLAVLL